MSRYGISPMVVFALLCWVVAASPSCRPAGYVPTPKDPNEPPQTIPVSETEHLSEQELTQAALLGVDIATPDIMRPPEDAVVFPSGLVSAVVRPGVGERTPRAGDTVVMHFVGWNDQGERFDSSRSRGTPDRFRLETLIPGWQEGVQHMVVGEVRRLWIPERLAFGSVPSPGRPSGDIVIEVELLDIISAPQVPAPKDIATPPPTARKTASGLQYEVLEPGTGTRHPTRDDHVLVHYTGWTLEGRMFDSSMARGKPLTLGLTEVIPGWTEMLQLMVEGERVRVWIPARLAYGETPARPGAPVGDLVFEIELIEIQ